MKKKNDENLLYDDFSCGTLYSGTTGVTGIKSVYAAENEIQERAATTNGVLNLNNGPASITIKGNDGQSLKGKKIFGISVVSGRKCERNGIH